MPKKQVRGRQEPNAGGGSGEFPARLRQGRLDAGLSLRELARRLEISASALSQIETGKSRPSVRTLYSVVSELGLSLDELFDQSGTPADSEDAPTAAAPSTDATPPARSAARHVVQHAHDRRSLDLASGVRWQRLTAEHDPTVDFLHVIYEVGGASNPRESLARHAGHEYGIVLTGSLEVTIGFETYHLEPGDSISFSSDEPHVLANHGEVPTTAIWFVVGRRGTDPRMTAFEADADGSGRAHRDLPA